MARGFQAGWLWGAAESKVYSGLHHVFLHSCALAQEKLTIPKQTPKP